MQVFFVYARVARLALAGALRVRALVHASSLSWGGGGGVGAQWSRREYLGRLRESVLPLTCTVLNWLPKPSPDLITSTHN